MDLVSLIGKEMVYVDSSNGEVYTAGNAKNYQLGLWNRGKGQTPC